MILLIQNIYMGSRINVMKGAWGKFVVVASYKDAGIGLGCLQSFILVIIFLRLYCWPRSELEGTSPRPCADVSLCSVLSGARSWWELAGKKMGWGRAGGQLLVWGHEPESLIKGMIRGSDKSIPDKSDVETLAERSLVQKYKTVLSITKLPLVGQG